MSSDRKQSFNFEMVGLSTGDKVIFEPLGIKVPISGPKTVFYEGKDWTLSAFVKAYIPKKKASGTYQGPNYFSYEGKTLTTIREERDKLRKNEEDW